VSGADIYVKQRLLCGGSLLDYMLSVGNLLPFGCQTCHPPEEGLGN
jgi:hypothetical protein